MNIKHTERQWGPRQREDLVSAKSTLAESRKAEVSMHLKYENFFKKKNILHLSIKVLIQNTRFKAQSCFPSSNLYKFREYRHHCQRADSLRLSTSSSGSDFTGKCEIM